MSHCMHIIDTGMNYLLYLSLFQLYVGMQLFGLNE